MSAPLSVSDLRKQFSIGRPAVDGVSFHVAAGEIVVLLGPSGCGKTTTLRCVAGLEHASAGRISIGAQVVSAPAEGVQVPPRLRNIGMVFQSYALWPHMTVRQNVAYPLRHRRLARAAIDRKVDEVLALVGLAEYAERANKHERQHRNHPDRANIYDRGEPASFDAKQRLADHFRDVVECTGDHQELQACSYGEVRRRRTINRP